MFVIALAIILRAIQLMKRKIFVFVMKKNSEEEEEEEFQTVTECRLRYMCCRCHTETLVD